MRTIYLNIIRTLSNKNGHYIHYPYILFVLRRFLRHITCLRNIRLISEWISMNKGRQGKSNVRIIHI